MLTVRFSSSSSCLLSNSLLFSGRKRTWKQLRLQHQLMRLRLLSSQSCSTSSFSSGCWSTAFYCFHSFLATKFDLCEVRKNKGRWLDCFVYLHMNMFLQVKHKQKCRTWYLCLLSGCPQFLYCCAMTVSKHILYYDNCVNIYKNDLI